MTATSQDTSGLNDRLARHFVRRLRREAERNAMGEAVAARFLREEYVDSGGRVLQVFHRREALPQAASGQQAAAMLARRRRRLVEETTHPVLGSRSESVKENEPELPPTTSAARIRRDHAPPDEAAPATEIVRAVREAAEPPRPSEVACLLLVAQALTNAERKVLDILRQRQPIVAIHCGTRHFEKCFLNLLARGLVLLGEVNRCNGYSLDRRELADSVNVRLASAYMAARGLVRVQKAAIEFLANTLVAEETLEGPQLDAILEQVRRKMVDPPP